MAGLITPLEVPASAASALISRVLGSEQFSRTVRLRDFLRYVASRSLAHPGSPIPEHDIGVAVFERRQGYDTATDNIVRVSAGDLRRRLEHYFLDQGRQEELICEMPRGGYALTFHPRPAPAPGPVTGDVSGLADSVEAPHAASPYAGASPEQPQRDGWKAWLTDRRTIMLAAIVLSTLCTGGYLYSRLSREPWERTSSLRAVWSQFMLPGSEVDVVLADSSLAITKSLTHTNIALSDYLGYGYRNLLVDPALQEQTRGALAVILSRNIGSISDFKATQQICGLTTHSEHFNLGSAHDFTPDVIKGKNVILVGSSVANPWVDLYRERRLFRMEIGTPGKIESIRNVKPLPGEQSEYRIPSDDADGSGYAVLAILPNFDPQKRVLIIEGNDSQATLAAGDFITSAFGAKAITDRLGRTSLPNHVEVLLRSYKLMATPLQAEIVAVHSSEE